MTTDGGDTVPAQNPTHYGTHLTHKDIPRTLELLTVSFTLFYPLQPATSTGARAKSKSKSKSNSQSKSKQTANPPTNDPTKYYRPRWFPSPAYTNASANIRSFHVPTVFVPPLAGGMISLVRGVRVPVLE